MNPIRPSKWTAVARSSDLRKRPLALTIDGVPLVMFRSGDGISCLTDRCPHRSAPLSGGTVVDGTIGCPYHGWRYGSDGACTRIPQLADPTRVPAKARATTFTCTERYGMIWVALEEPRWAMPGNGVRSAFSSMTPISATCAGPRSSMRNRLPDVMYCSL